MSHPEATRQDKVKQMWRVKLTEGETTELPKHSATDCLLQITHPSVLKLHWWHLISSC
jgi:hypothetical protein